METLWQDLKFGARALLKNPAFTAVAVLTLALGIGVNSTVFSVVNAYLFQPLPVKDPDQLVALGTKDTTFEVPYEMSYPNYEDLRDLKEVFSDAIAFRNAVFNVAADGQPERTWAEFVTGNYFSMLGVDAVAGRTFTPEESRVPGAEPVVVLSFAYWQKRFGGQESAIGRTMKLNGIPFTIIGVAPQSFKGTESVLALEIYVPLGMQDQLYPKSAGRFAQRGNTSLRVLARLKPGVSLEQAGAAVEVLARQLEQKYPETNRATTFALALETHSRPVISIAQYVPRIAGVFMMLVGLVLLIACANVANLMLARGMARQKEIAIRLALGAGRARIVRLMLTESMLLAVAGGMIGWLLSFWAIDWLTNIRVSTDAPVRFAIEPDWRVQVFSLGIAVLTGLISGVAPALQTSSPNLNETLKEGGRSSAASGRHRIRTLLVVGQVAVSLLVLICAGLFIQSAKNAEKIDMGFLSENLSMASMDPEAQGYDEARGRRFFKQLTDRVGTLPGVTNASLASTTPLGYNNNNRYVFFEGRAAGREEEDRTAIFCNTVGHRYFQTMGTAVLRGREFTERDDESSPKVAIVNETMAKRYWPDQDALGKRFALKREGPYLEVVGVVRDGKYVFLGEDPRAFFYIPFGQDYQGEMTVVVRSAGDDAAALAGIRQVVQELDRELPLYDVKTMTSHLRDGIALLFVRLGARLATAFGLLGLVLAVVGVYGVVSYSVSQRTHEIGVRMALGANAGDILKLVVGKGLMLTLVGVAIGLGSALMVTRVMTSLLYDVSATDPLTFGLIAVLLSGVALAASLIPVRRALKVDPMVALRYE
ncbi:MAG TPA: ABC transporter permease [Blastocatellia bacterium]|nr:ABC transporter permease [Blastocatellia bacterium]